MPRSKRKRPPHLLCGADLRTWLELLDEHGVCTSEFGRSLLITAASLLGLPWRVVDSVQHQIRVRRVRFDAPPVFVLGHWQGGCGPVHYLMARDPQFAYLKLGHCVLPASLASSGIVQRLVKGKLPSDRVVDAMSLGFNTPQGDDMALAQRTTLSFYHAHIFPRSARQVFRRAVLFEGVSSQSLNRWHRIYSRLMQRVAYDQKKSRVLMRGAAHTGRVRFLLKWFPDAKFIYVHRDRDDVCSAVISGFARLRDALGLQKSSAKELRETTESNYELVIRRYERDRDRIPKGNLVEVAHEVFRRDPLDEAKRIYETLSLPGFADAEPHFARYLAANENV